MPNQGLVAGTRHGHYTICFEIFAPAVGLQDANYSNRLYLRNQRLRAVATTEMAMAMMKP